jgi:hypothetical protein
MNRISVSISGGRTSAFMAQWVLANQRQVADYLGATTQLDIRFTFANTGMEHDDTLRFLNDVDQRLLDGRVVWLEAVPAMGERKSSGHRVVTYETAFRNSQWRDPQHPFHSVIRKYGVPNKSWSVCTRELKLNPIKSYYRNIGWASGSYVTAIGIREDENRRVSARAGQDRIVYPLVHLEPTTKDDVLAHFERWAYDLRIPEYLGNCVTCYKKSFNKLAAVHSVLPHAFEFNQAMETEFGFVGPEFQKHSIEDPRVFFRGRISTPHLLDLFTGVDVNPTLLKYAARDGGCSESCEVYETEAVDDLI